MAAISPRRPGVPKRKDFLGVVSFLFMDRRVCRLAAPQSDRGWYWVECVWVCLLSRNPVRQGMHESGRHGGLPRGVPITYIYK